jgi:RNA polymerase sigma-70 factor (ECF subfamily)
LFTWSARICCNTAIDYARTGRFRLAARTASLEDTPGFEAVAAPGFKPEHIGVFELLVRLRPGYRQAM